MIKEKLMQNLHIEDGINKEVLLSNRLHPKNKLGEPNIFIWRGRYRVEFTIAKKHEFKVFDTLEEAIEYRNTRKEEILKKFSKSS